MPASRDPSTGRYLPGPGSPHSPEHREKIGAAQRGIPNPKRGQKGAAHHGWTGDNVTYFALHKWVRRHKGPPSAHVCIECGKPAEEWANISGEYRRDLDDFMPMCRSCHKKHDHIVLNFRGRKEEVS